MADRTPMTYACSVLADSVSDGVRLTTLQIRFPRIVLAEFNTHRMLSRNSASSRAIPVEQRIAAVERDPFVPEVFGRNQRGMRAGAALEGEPDSLARQTWLQAAAEACASARQLAQHGVHKQLANRLLEPFLWTEVIVTATEWDNFFHLRCNPHAQPEIQRAAEAMRGAMAASTPAELVPGDWHLPLIDEEDRRAGRPVMELVKMSAARCARVSYLTHAGRRDPEADLALHDRLLRDGHMSPFEHPARCGTRTTLVLQFVGNFLLPWVQYRKMLPNEADPLGVTVST